MNTQQDLVAGGMRWRFDGLCSQVDPHLFLPDKGEYTNTQAAKRICGECPIRRECLDYALDNHETWGVWGGTDPRQRRKLLRDRRERHPHAA